MTRLTSDQPASRPSPAIDLRARLLAETVRGYEQDGAALQPAGAADAVARETGGDLETRIVRRGAALPAAPALGAALDGVRRVFAWMLIAALVLAAMSGAGAVRAALGGAAGPVNVFLVLSSLLGIQTALLLLWLVLASASPSAVHVSPLGDAAVAAGRWIAARTRRGPEHVAALRAVTSIFAQGAIARWTFSAISHALWSAVNAGGLIVLVVLLSTRHYTFNWETTILTDDAYVRITRVLAWLPEAIGFQAPTPDQIRGSEGDASRKVLDDARVAWSGLLVGSIALYGFAPRLLLLMLSIALHRRARRRYRLDTSRPGYVRLRERLMPQAEGRGRVGDGDGRGATTAAPAHAEQKTAEPGAGPPVIVGLEIDPPAGPWPPKLHAVRWVDLGFVDAREDRRRVETDLRDLSAAPRMTVVVCSLVTTPDRGLGAFVAQIVEAARGPVALVLTGGDALRHRGGVDQLEQRVDDWRRLGVGAGVDAARVVELDLDHLTDTSVRRLGELVGADGDATGAANGDRLDLAFALIDKTAVGWAGPPPAGEEGRLHQRIAEMYRGEAPSLASLLHLPKGFTGDPLAQMKASAKSLVRVLPDRLRRSPAWLAAGGVAGALGCVAVGTLVAPAAFAAIPAWALGGAGLSGLIQLAAAIHAVDDVGERDDGDNGEAKRDEDGDEQLARAVRAAALFALLLELQGRDEASISRVLDGTLPDEATEGEFPVALGGAATVMAWLREVRVRFDAARQGEERPT